MTIDPPPYKEPADQDLILRDWLAIDRTALANERTLLAYTRTGLALMIVGGSLIKLFDSLIADASGVVFLVAGFATVAVGLARFRDIRRRLLSIGRRSKTRPDGADGPSRGDSGARP